jgi:hypothetical protein
LTSWSQSELLDTTFLAVGTQNSMCFGIAEFYAFAGRNRSLNFGAPL